MPAGFAVAFCSLASIGQSFNKAAMRMFGTFMAICVAFTLIALWFAAPRLGIPLLRFGQVYMLKVYSNFQYA